MSKIFPSFQTIKPIVQHPFKNVNNCLNTNIYSYLEKSGDQSSNLYLNIAQFFNASVNKTCVAAYDSCLIALMSNTCCSIPHWVMPSR